MTPTAWLLFGLLVLNTSLSCALLALCLELRKAQRRIEKTVIPPYASAVQRLVEATRSQRVHVITAPRKVAGARHD